MVSTAHGWDGHVLKALQATRAQHTHTQIPLLAAALHNHVTAAHFLVPSALQEKNLPDRAACELSPDCCFASEHRNV